MPSRLYRKKLVVLFSTLVFTLLACSSVSPTSSNKDVATGSSTAAQSSPNIHPSTATSTSVEDQILISVSQALRRSKLLTRPDQCYAYTFDPAAGKPAYAVDVRENHNRPECGGDAQTQPHLFTVHVEKSTHTLSADIANPGVFQPIAP